MTHITDENFDEMLKNNALLLIDFSATWCGPCRMMAPVIDELSATYDGRMCITKADVDEAQNVAERLGIRSVPTILFFKKGELLDTPRFIGAVPKAKLVEAIESLL